MSLEYIQGGLSIANSIFGIYATMTGVQTSLEVAKLQKRVLESQLARMSESEGLTETQLRTRNRKMQAEYDKVTTNINQLQSLDAAYIVNSGKSLSENSLFDSQAMRYWNDKFEQAVIDTIATESYDKDLLEGTSLDRAVYLHVPSSSEDLIRLRDAAEARFLELNPGAELEFGFAQDWALSHRNEPTPGHTQVWEEANTKPKSYVN